MELPNSYKARLDELECLFKWRPDIGGKQKPVEWFIEKCEIGMEEAPFMTLHELAILSYLYTLKSPKMSITKAIDSIKQANKWQENNPQERFMTCDFVLRANKLHIEYLICMQDKVKLSQLEKEWSNIKLNPKLNPKQEAAVWGTMGYAMSRFSKDKQGIEAFEKAWELDKDNPSWHFGLARLIDGNKEEKLGMYYQTSGDKKEMLEKAYNLGKDLRYGENAVYAARYGEALVNSKEQRAQCLDLIRFAHRNAGQNQSIYRICAKSYKKLEKYRDCKNCLKEGIDKCPDNAALHCALGMYFRYNKIDMNLRLAKEQFENSNGYFWAEMQLLLMKIDGELKGKTTDILEEFAKLAAMSTKKATYRAALHKERGLYLLKCGGKDDIAVEDFLKTAMSETNDQYGHALQARKEIITALEDRIKTEEKRKKTEEERRKIEKERIETGEERIETGWLKAKRDLALFLQKCQPQMDKYLEESATLYKEILDTNDMNSEDTSFIVENYGDALIRLKRYKEAIQVLDKTGTSEEKKRLEAQAHIGAAAEAGVSDLAKEHLRRCLLLRCKDGAEDLLKQLKDKVKMDTKVGDNNALCFQQDRSLYKDCALIMETAKHKDAFSLKAEPPVSKEAIIEGEIVEILGLNVPDFRELRNSRYEMSLDPDGSPTKIVPVLCEARNQLDRVHKRLLETLNPKANLRIYFPLRLKLQSEGDTVKENLRTFFKDTYKYREGNERIMIWEEFAEENHKSSEDLLDFLARKQEAGQKWLQKWFDLTNNHKHCKELTQKDLDEWTKLLDTGRVSNHAEAAHVVAEFAEEHVAKYDSIMRECFEI